MLLQGFTKQRNGPMTQCSRIYQNCTGDLEIPRFSHRFIVPESMSGMAYTEK